MKRPAYIQDSINGATWDKLCQMGLATILTAIIVVTFYIGVIKPASGAPVCQQDNDGRTICGTLLKATRSTAQFSDANGNIIQVLGGRPAGCPRAYCGCALAKHLGINDRRLNLAWSWARMFRRTSAAPGMAAVRRGHVMLLVEHVAGTKWIVKSFNDYRRLSYIIKRDVRGYVFVDPSSSTLSARSR